MASYLVKDPEGNKVIIQATGFTPSGAIAQVPDGEEAVWLVPDEDRSGFYKVDEQKKFMVLRERAANERAAKEHREALDEKLVSKGYGTISQDDLAGVKSFDGLKRYISYLLDKVGALK